jgi:hypothetical protein
VCARSNSALLCWLSDGAGFPTRIEGPAWSDDAGWGEVDHWSTIRLADLNGDGMDDVCGRAPAGVECHLSTGDGFGPKVAGPAWSDASGWGDHANYDALRLADLDGDRRADICARAGAGIRCALWTGESFGSAFSGPELSDASGWYMPKYYATVRLADVNGDRKADLCARAAAGFYCWLSDGSGFPTRIDGPAYSDTSGWGAIKYYSTLQADGPRCRALELCGNGRDDDCDGVIDNGCDLPDAGPPDSDGGPKPDGGDALDGASRDGGDSSAVDAGADSGGADQGNAATGCGCALDPPRTFLSILSGLAMLLAVTILRRRS